MILDQVAVAVPSVGTVSNMNLQKASGGNIFTNLTSPRLESGDKK
jgi:hypothetical protein